MKKIIIATDLDNTLIHSYKHRNIGDVCVEEYRDKEQSFMTKRTIELLREIIKKAEVVPITTRSVAQYKRIKWPDGCEPRLAVTTNGAVLMKDGIKDKKWCLDYKSITSPWGDELKKQYTYWSPLQSYSSCNVVDESYLCLCCKEKADKYDVFYYQDKTDLQVEISGRKIYFFPLNLDKGKALMKLRGYLQGCIVYAAGDSNIDIPMLKKADVAFGHRNLQGMVFDNCKIQPAGTIFSDWWLECIMSML